MGGVVFAVKRDEMGAISGPDASLGIVRVDKVFVVLRAIDESLPQAFVIIANAHVLSHDVHPAEPHL
jgi:hypothetical protein